MKETAVAQPLALLYVRVSTGRQANLGHSIESQTAALTTAAASAGYAVEIIIETGSSKAGSRPVLNGALATLKAGKAQALYALDLDRLARSTIHLLEIARDAKKQGWRLVVTSNDFDSTTPAGQMFFVMMSAAGEYEQAMISQRVQRQHEARRDRGEIWGANVGPRSPLPSATIARVVELRSEGLTMQAIADRMTADSVPTAKGGKWSSGKVCEILNSPAQRISA
jgi:DNA invertase Pin-like site-specific DNA recombinase